MNCNICIDKFNMSGHARVACPYCAFEACRTCCETYILGQPMSKCMNATCGREWQRKFLVSVFPKSFISGPWKKHREKILLDKEIALLPATQAVVEAEIYKYNLREEVKDIDRQIAFLVDRRRNLGVEINNGVVIRTTTKFVRSCSGGDCRGFLSCQWKCGL